MKRRCRNKSGMTSISALAMTLLAKPFHLVASAFYRIAYKLHHKLFLRPQPPIQVPVIIVGSYLVGGAGKTPFTIWLARCFKEQGKRTAVLCHSVAWDEFIMMQREFGNDSLHSAELFQIKVFSTKNRYKTAKEIQDKFDIILCDDGFEDTRFAGAHYICLDWHKPPTSWKSLLPSGPFRSLKQDHDERKVIHIDCLGANGNPPDIRFYIKSITNYIPGEPLSATIICGLGTPYRFIEDINAFTKTSENASNIHIKKIIIRPDHDKHFTHIVQSELFCGNDIIISQKDACRLPQQLLCSPKIHIAIQETKISDKILELLLNIPS